LAGFAMFALVYFTPLLLQGGLGLSPSAAGLFQTPLAASTALGALLGTQFFARTQRMKAVMIWGALCMLGGTLLLLGVDSSIDPLRLAIILALAGWGVGFILPMLTLLVQSIIPRARMGVATSTVQFLRLIGSTIGTAVIASAVNALFGSQMRAAFTADTDPRVVEAFHNPQAVIDPTTQATLQTLMNELSAEAAIQVQQLTDVAHNALVSGVRLGYVMALVISVAIMALVLLIRIPNFRANEKRMEAPKHEESVEIV